MLQRKTKYAAIDTKYKVTRTNYVDKARDLLYYHIVLFCDIARDFGKRRARACRASVQTLKNTLRRKRFEILAHIALMQ